MVQGHGLAAHLVPEPHFPGPDIVFLLLIAPPPVQSNTEPRTLRKKVNTHVHTQRTKTYWNTVLPNNAFCPLKFQLPEVNHGL